MRIRFSFLPRRIGSRGAWRGGCSRHTEPGLGGGRCRCCGLFLDPQLEHAETCSNAKATRQHHACVHAAVCGVKLADPGITTEPNELTASQSRPADILTTAAVPGRSAALDVCVASTNAAAARRDAAQTAFDRKQSHYRNEIGELRQEGIHYRPLVWTADGRPHPAVTRTHQHAADVASKPKRESKSLSCAGGQPRHAQFSRILQRAQSGSSQASSTELCTTRDVSPLSTAGSATTTSTTLGLTQQYVTTTMTLSPSRCRG